MLAGGAVTIAVLVSCSSETDPAPPPTDPPAAGDCDVKLTDVTSESGIEFTHENGFSGEYYYLELMGGGVGLFDYDGDGFLDVYFLNGNNLGTPPAPELTNVLYRNDGDGTFTDVTASAGVGDPSYSQGCCCADYDSDGDQDLFVSNYGPDRLYRNDGDGTFTDVTEESGIDNPLWGQACAFLDFDNDGWLDLYVQNYLGYTLEGNRTSEEQVDGHALVSYAGPLDFPGAPDFLYRNDGDGTFTDVSRDAGIHRPNGRGMGLACADFDEDGDTDLFVSNDAMENYYFENRGDGTFVDKSVMSGLAYQRDGSPQSSMGADVGDYDGDGLLDIVCPALPFRSCTLYRNTGGHFLDVSLTTGIIQATHGTTGFSPNLVDADNDGDLDLFLCNGAVLINTNLSNDAIYVERYGIVYKMLINDVEGRYTSAGASAGSHFTRTLVGRGSAAGDIDNDGDVDLILSNLTYPPTVLRNDSKRRNWITLVLVPSKGNRDAIGARIRLTADGRTQTAAIRGGGCYLSANDRRPHFGLGEASSVERLEIRWPDGEVQTLTDVAANRFAVIRQPTE